MLYRLIIQNYKSFRDRNEFSMIPGSDNRHASYIDSSMPVLRDAIIYGANAAGKSNIVKALSFIRNLVTSNNTLSSSGRLSFRLDKELMESPTLFMNEMRIGDVLYQYGMVVSFCKDEIQAEWLKAYPEGADGWTDVFSRYYSEEDNCNNINFHFNKESCNAARYPIYKQDLSLKTDVLVLTELARKSLHGDMFISAINEVYKWFEDLIIIFPETRYNLLGTVARDLQAVNDLYKKYFKIFGIDIEEIRLTDVNEKYLRLPEVLIDDLRTDLKKEDGENKFAMLHGNRQDYLAMLDANNELKFSEVTFIHKLKDNVSEFSITEESDGTQRLFDLIPMLGYIVSTDRVAVIDEIDRSLHCLLTRQMFRYFIQKSEERHSQLICTTHQVLLMDMHLLGRREIWFVEKKDKASHIYPLDQYKFDGEKINLADNYLIGRFGAIPKY